MFKLRFIILLSSLLVLGSCALGWTEAEPGALEAAEPKQWNRIGIDLYTGSYFYSDFLRFSNQGSFSVPVPNAGKLPQELAMEFASQIEKETGVETIVLPRSKITSQEEPLLIHEINNVDAVVRIHVQAEGLYFPSGYEASSSLTIYVTIFDALSYKVLWDVKQRNSDPSSETSLTLNFSDYQFARFSYGVYSHQESGMVDYVSGFNSKMYIGAYDSAIKHVPRIVSDLVSDMGLPK